MMAFRSRKRKAGAPRETQAKTPPADAAATTPTGSPTKHPVAAFANTVYVDPVIKVRRRARSRPRIARAIESARLSRLSAEAYRFETKNKTRFHAAPVKALTKSTPLFLDVTPPERVSIRG